MFSQNTQESQTIPATQPTPQTPEGESVLHEPVLDKNILSQLVGNQLKVHPTQSNQESLAKAFGILEQVQKLRQNLNQIQLGPLEPAEEEGGEKKPELSPPEMALKKMVQEGFIPTRGAEGQRVLARIRESSTENKKYKKKPKTLQEKAQLRLEMGKLMTAKAETKHVRTEEEDHTTTSLGEYLPFTVSWQKEGHDEAGYQAPT